MTTTSSIRNPTRAVLDQIDALINNADYDTRKEVVAVLRAVRGPDIENDELKMATTCRIRHAAFPLSGSEFGLTSSEVVYESKLHQCVEMSRHFGTAVSRAAFALGIVTNGE